MRVTNDFNNWLMRFDQETPKPAFWFGLAGVAMLALLFYIRIP